MESAPFLFSPQQQNQQAAMLGNYLKVLVQIDEVSMLVYTANREIKCKEVDF